MSGYIGLMTTVLNTTIRPEILRGRGAPSNQMGRYEKQTRFLVDDGWDDGWRSEDATPPSIRTEVIHDATRSIITSNKSPDLSFDFESRLFFKPEAAALLRRELAAPGYKPRVMAMGTNTDPYQPLEKKMRITRSVLEVLRDFKHPVAIVTKSPLILRDLDILSDMSSMGLAKAALSITTLDRKLARAMEPRAGTPARRLQAIRGLAEAGIPAGVMFAPAIPALNDHEMEAVLAASKEAGARSAGYVLLRLPLEIKDLFREWLEAEVPGRAKHVMALVRSMRGGKDYDSQWNTRMRGTGPYAQMMARRFHMAVKKLGLNQPSRPLAINDFRRPPRIGDQLSLL